MVHSRFHRRGLRRQQPSDSRGLGRTCPAPCAAEAVARMDIMARDDEGLRKPTLARRVAAIMGGVGLVSGLLFAALLSVIRAEEATARHPALRSRALGRTRVRPVRAPDRAR